MSDENRARPALGEALCLVQDVPVHGAICVDREAGEHRWSVIITRSVDAVAAFENLCPHARMPMERPDGSVVVQEGKFLVCTAHGASFHLATGDYVAGPGIGCGLTRVPVQQEEGRVVLADPPPNQSPL
ncbi:MAG: Rieske (2Fe-2S) protein [Caulobacterales bacterium]|jgi:nitrite reductase/ring-hydroxylating ferredoxin subunit